MNRAEKREALIRLHAAKLVHARLLGCEVHKDLKKPTRMSIHWLQININERAKYGVRPGA